MRTTVLMGLVSLVVIAPAAAQTAGPTVTPAPSPAGSGAAPPSSLAAPKLGAAETPLSAIAPVAPGAAAPAGASTLARTPAARIARGPLPAPPSVRIAAKPASTGTGGVTKSVHVTPKGAAHHGRQTKTLAKATPKAHRVHTLHAGHSVRPAAAKAATHPTDLVRPRV